MHVPILTLSGQPQAQDPSFQAIAFNLLPVRLVIIWQTSQQAVAFAYPSSVPSRIPHGFEVAFAHINDSVFAPQWAVNY